MLEINKENLFKLVKSRGRMGQRTLDTLSRQKEFYEAIHSDKGYILLKDIIDREDQLLAKLTGSDPTDVNAITQEERIEYKVIKELIFRWCNRINSYESDVNNINDGKL